MADNNTPIALPEQTDEADSVLTSAVQATEQATDQHVEPHNAAVAPAPAIPAQAGENGNVGPLGLVVSSQ
ncbi:hypothetical protein [Kitasatospora kifunensis]|uniref:Uncharacterized protein n=1 Tax=Kitasatospora kifunensis TaxID=58351 RepID=A0A7W7R1Q1_KITKI|nr:hypothetical protein [Kitasatospora kifunensis]MBB4923797.1 hypothetical protein [Kitasatospora kifunensis]